MKRLTRFIVLAAAIGILGTSQARAGLLPVNVTTNSEGDHFRWTYNIVLPTDSQLRTGDYFTIYDFAGLVATSNVQPDGWTFSTSNTGPVPDGVDPDDQTTLPNLTWRYTGPTISSGQTGLGNFWAVSLYEEATDSFFTARTHRTTDGAIDTNITDTVVPVPTANTGTNLVPEPTTLLLAGLGLPIVGLMPPPESANGVSAATGIDTNSDTAYSSAPVAGLVTVSGLNFHSIKPEQEEMFHDFMSLDSPCVSGVDFDSRSG